MKTYVVVAPLGVTFHADAILADLTKEQQARMSHALEPVKGKRNQFRVLSDVMFKRGETVTTAASVNKAQVADLAPEDSKLAQDTAREVGEARGAARNKADGDAAAVADEEARRLAARGDKGAEKGDGKKADDGKTAAAGDKAEGDVVRGGAGATDPNDPPAA